MPTKTGITLSAALWQSFANKMDYLRMSSMSSKSEIVEEELILSTLCNENTSLVSVQRFFQQKDFIRVFIPSVCLLTESEWDNLRNIRKTVTSDIIRLMYSKVFRKMIKKEIEKETPASEDASEIENVDAEMVLTTSMVELLKSHLESRIGDVFECTGCDLNHENQLGHDCVTMNHDRRLHRYGDIAILSMDLELLAREFVQQNLHIINYVTDDFLNRLDMLCLIQNAKDLYILSDPCPDRLF